MLMSFGKRDIPGAFGQNVDFDIQLGLLRLDLYSLSVSGATLRTIKEGIIAIHPTVLRHGIWLKKSQTSSLSSEIEENYLQQYVL